MRPVTREGVVEMADTDLTTEASDTDEGELDVLEVVAMNASTTAIGSVSTDEFDASQCLICSATVEGDASIGASAVGMLSASSVGVHQGCAGLIASDGDVSIDQGGACMVLTQTAGIEQGGVGVLVASEATLARSWVGVMAARNATLSDDSRVVIDTRSALIIGGLLFGGLGLVAVGIFMAGKRIASRLPHMPHIRAPHMPHLADLPRIELPKVDLPAVIDLIAKLRRAS
jgi:hypothetical protein